MDASALIATVTPTTYRSGFDERQDVVGHVLAALSRESTVDRLYSHAMDAVAVALHVDRASLLIFDHEEHCRFVAWRGLSDAYRQSVDGHSPWTPRDLDATPIAISDVTRDTGINRGTLTRLYHETAERVELDVLDALCVYLNCGLPDLLEYQKSEQASPVPLADSNG